MRREFDFQEEEIILIEKATKRKEEEFLKQKNKEKAFLLRKDVLQDYFKHMSTANKEKFIRDFIDSITSINLVSALLNLISIGDAKLFVYAALYDQTDFKFDKFVLDHDRCLNKRELEIAITNDTQWFHTLDVDDQMDIIISLIWQSGGHIQRNLFFPVYRKCIRKREFLMEQQEEPDRNKITQTDSEDIYLDHPATIEVENRRKNWNQIISRYREKVEGVKKEALKEKVEKSVKEKASTTKSASSKSGETVKGNGTGTDWIQLLPVWIVKKIFSYFDQKTVQKVKKVNAYWSFMTQEVMKERKMRMQLNKEIEKMHAEIGSSAMEEEFTSEELVRSNHKGFKPVRNYERGAIVKELVPQATDNLVQTSLIADVLKEVNEDFFTDKIVSFSREVNMDSTLYRHQPCFLRDVNVVLGEQEDVKVQKSILTYSLSTQSGSLDITIDRQTLEEW